MAHLAKRVNICMIMSPRTRMTMFTNQPNSMTITTMNTVI